jgi:hypothetical protein
VRSAKIGLTDGSAGSVPGGVEIVARPAGAIFDQELANYLGAPLSKNALGQLATALATARDAATPVSDH